MSAATDRFDPTSLRNPAYDLQTVTPSDSTDLPGGVCKSLHVGSAGDIKVTTAAGTVLVIPNVPAGVYPARFRRIWAAGTVATGLCAMY